MVDRRGFATRAIHAGEARDESTNAHNTPIYQTATFTFGSAEEMAAAMAEPFDNFFYSRTGNPTPATLEQKLASLEGAEEAAATSSGMAAVATAVLATARSGDHLIVSEDVFVISRQFFADDCADLGIEVSFVDITDLDAVRSAVQANTTLLFTETITNPHMSVADLPALRTIADDHNLTFIVDNTFLSPALLRPLEYGADLVVHSATKYLSGHGDTIAGMIAGPANRFGRIRLKLDALGQCLSPFNAWLVLRGMRTLPMRMKTHSTNAMALARMLEGHPTVQWISYPGLAQHPDHEIAKTLLGDNFGGMLSIRLNGGAAEMNRFANALKLAGLGVSLGDVYTLAYPQPRRENLIRISVGCEDVDDILADFRQALSQIA